MRCVEVIECTVTDGAMPDFVNAVQQWERAALRHPAAPGHHAVLFDQESPARVTIVTQFRDIETADEFAASGLLDRFMEGVLRCVEPSTSRRRYDLFYAAGGEGPRAIFGETPRDDA